MILLGSLSKNATQGMLKWLSLILYPKMETDFASQMLDFFHNLSSLFDRSGRLYYYSVG